LKEGAIRKSIYRQKEISVNFTPAVYEHAAACIGKTPWEASRKPEHLFRAHAEAYRRYRHRPIVAGIDIYNVEAEAYGALVEPARGNVIPSIAQNPCTTIREISDLRHPDPDSSGRLPMVLETASRLNDSFPDADVRVPLSGPFSLASNLLGFDTLLCEVLTDPDASRQALLHLAEGQITVCKAIARAGLQTTVFESGAAPPLLSPKLFQDLVFPAVQRLISAGNELFNHPPAFVIGGNTVPILEDLLATGTRYLICPSETDQKLFMERMGSRLDVTVRVNVDPGLFATGPWELLAPELERAAALARLRENTHIGSGVLPYETAPELVFKARDYVSSL
jgi:uroporphyrinogen decarboxylase